jgi:hypothetical protein
MLWFESCLPSQAVRSPDCIFPVAGNHRHSRGLGWRVPSLAGNFRHFCPLDAGFGRRSLLAFFQFPFLGRGDGPKSVKNFLSSEAAPALSSNSNSSVKTHTPISLARLRAASPPKFGIEAAAHCDSALKNHTSQSFM